MVVGDPESVTRPPVPLPAASTGTENTDQTPVLAVLNARWRVVLFDNKVEAYRQWVLQHRIGATWTTKPPYGSFCQTRKSLLTAIREKIVRRAGFYRGGKSMEVKEAALAAVEASPERIYAADGNGINPARLVGGGPLINPQLSPENAESR
jgi:hypothetical protein